MSNTAIVLVLEEAEPLIGETRQEHTPGGARGLPAHVTLLSPWVDSDDYDDAVKAELADVVRTVPSFELALTDVAQFESGVLYLSVSPIGVVRDLISRICATFPEYLPYGRFTPDEVIPHCTLATGSGFPNSATAEDLSVFDEVGATVAKVLPIRCRVQRVTVMNDTPDGWRVAAECSLASADTR